MRDARRHGPSRCVTLATAGRDAPTVAAMTHPQTLPAAAARAASATSVSAVPATADSDGPSTGGQAGRQVAAPPAPARLRIVAVSGSLHRPSSTTALVAALAEAVAQRIDAAIEVVELAEVGPHLAGALERSALPREAERAIATIEAADLLVVGSPVYRASFTGLFKHLFDFVDQGSLIDTPVLLAATGGSHRHALTIEHQLRPLFAFFQALTLPVGVYASNTDFDGYVISSEVLQARIALAAERALPLVGYAASRPVEPLLVS